MNCRISAFSYVLVAIAVLAGGSADAQQARSGGGGSEQLVLQLQQLASERTELQAQNATLQKSLDDTRKQLDSLKQQLAAAKSGAAHSQADLSAALASARESAQAAKDNSAKNIADAKSKMQELIDRFRETVVQLRDSENEGAQARQQLVQNKLAFDKCAQRNVEISQLTNSVLDRYQHEGLFSHLGRDEPFTRLKRTQVENLVLEDRQHVEELRVKDAASTTPTTTAPQGVQFRTNSDGR